MRERLDQHIKAGKFKDISELTRKALEEFLKGSPVFENRKGEIENAISKTFPWPRKIYDNQNNLR